MSYTPIPHGTEDWDVPVNAALTSQDSRITGTEAGVSTNTSSINTLNGQMTTANANIATNTANISTNTSNITTNTSNITTLQGQMTTANTNIATNTTNITSLTNATDALEWQPDDQGFFGWTSDPILAGSTGSSLTAGTVFMNAVPVRKNVTLNTISVQIITAGATLTASQNFAGVYNAAGTLVAVTADQSSNWTSTGYKAMNVTTPVALTPGIYYVALLANGTTPPQMARGNVVSGAWYNANLSNATLRTSTGGTGLTGLTSLPSTVTMSNRGSGATALWNGLL